MVIVRNASRCPHNRKRTGEENKIYLCLDATALYPTAAIL